MTHAEIFAVVRRIPRGRVATYGQVATLAGHPGHARQVGYALSALEIDAPVPWHRVVNAQGRVSMRSGGSGGAMVQRTRLEAEGVVFVGGKVRLRDFLWSGVGGRGSGTGVGGRRSGERQNDAERRRR